MAGGWKSDSWSVVLLDKYREKQRHGGSNENENKGALRNYDYYGSRVQQGDARKPRYVSDARCANSTLPAGKKNRQNKVNDMKERDRRGRSCSRLDFLNRASDSRDMFQFFEINERAINVYNIFLFFLSEIF